MARLTRLPGDPVAPARPLAALRPAAGDDWPAASPSIAGGAPASFFIGELHPLGEDLPGGLGRLRDGSREHVESRLIIKYEF